MRRLKVLAATKPIIARAKADRRSGIANDRTINRVDELLSWVENR